MAIPEAKVSLKPCFFIHLEVEEGVPVYTNSATSLTQVVVKNGYTKTLDPETPFDTEITHGGDDLTTNPAGAVNLDCRLYGKTKSGHGFSFSYFGVVQFNEKILSILSNKGSDMSFEDGYVTSNPVIKLDAKAEAEQWVYKYNLVGKGRFIRNEQGVLCVEYHVFRVVA